MSVSDKANFIRLIVQLVVDVVPAIVSIIKEIVIAVKEIKTVS